MPSRTIALFAVITFISGGLPSLAQAGPLVDWLFGGRRAPPAYPVGTPIPLGGGYGAAPAYSAGYAYPGYAANLGNYYGAAMPVIGPSGAGYNVPVPGGIAAATLPPQTFSYVPNYNSSALRAPVTYYRPIMTTDPKTGAQVVAMSPCTSYQYMTQRVPALGQTTLYGNYQQLPAQFPATRTIPSYTLPSGGIPIAQGSPSISLPQTSVTYGPYTTYQPAVNYQPGTAYQSGTTYQPSLVAPPATSSSPAISGYSAPVTSGIQNYSTHQLGTSPYYSGTNGGSTGSAYSAPVPGLVAPQSPYSTSPGYPVSPSNPMSPNYPAQPNGMQPVSPPPTSNFSTPSYPSPSFPANPVLPSTNDPADSSPSLNYNGLRPTLRSIIPDASSSGAESASNREPSLNHPALAEPRRDLPVISPIPAPEGLEKPRWSPGLLREGDMTALRPITRASEYAGQSKKIHWASFDHEPKNADDSQSSVSFASPESNTQSTADGSVQWAVQLAPSTAVTSNEIRMVVPPTAALRLESSTSSAYASPTRYDNSGWKASR